MNVLLGALVLLLLGLLGSRFSFTWSHTPLGPRTFLMAGTHFLLVGLLLGSDAVGLLTPAVLRPLYPLLGLGLGWIGLLYGLQLDLQHLRDLPRPLYTLTFLQGALSFLCFAGLGWAVLSAAGGLDEPDRAALLGAAAVACTSSPLGIAVLVNLTRLRGRLGELLLFVASLDGLVGIVALQLVFAIYHPLGVLGGQAGPAGPGLPVVALAIGLAGGMIVLWLVRTRPGRAELSLFLMGTAAFVAGAAFYLGLSPLFVAVTAGVLIANNSPLRARIFRALHRSEKPLYVIVLVVAGATARLTQPLVLPLALGYIALRLASKLAAGWAAARLLPRGQRPPGAFGLAFAAQSGMPVALLLSMAMSYGLYQPRTSPALELMVGSVVLAIILSELLGPFLTRAVLQHAGEQVGPLLPLEHHRA